MMTSSNNINKGIIDWITGTGIFILIAFKLQI